MKLLWVVGALASMSLMGGDYFCGTTDFKKTKQNLAKYHFLEGNPVITNKIWRFVLRMGEPESPLTDGSTSWNMVMSNAFHEWNRHLTKFQFEVVIGETGEGRVGNGVNEVYIADSDGRGGKMPEGYSAIAASNWYFFPSNNFAETDIIFSPKLPWDSYRQNHVPFKVDIYRVALHEIGHALGLGHLPEDQQQTRSVMNVFVDLPPVLQLDDIQGAQALYPVPLGIKPPNGPLLELRGMAGRRINVFHSSDLHNWRFIDSVFNETTQTNIPVDVGADYGFFRVVEE